MSKHVLAIIFSTLASISSPGAAHDVDQSTSHWAGDQPIPLQSEVAACRQGCEQNRAACYRSCNSINGSNPHWEDPERYREDQRRYQECQDDCRTSNNTCVATCVPRVR